MFGCFARGGPKHDVLRGMKSIGWKIRSKIYLYSLMPSKPAILEGQKVYRRNYGVDLILD
jgi:hypothetical protein